MNRRTAIIGFAAAGFLLAIWFFLLWGPQGGELEKAKDREDVAASENQELELRLARLRASQEKAPSLQAELAELRAAVPDGPDLAQFILDAHTIAEESGVEFTSINQTPPAPSTTGGPPSIALTISVSGGYFEVLDYLDRLDSLGRIVVIDGLTLSPADQNGLLQVGASITARMFTTGTDAAAVPAPAPVVSTQPTTTTTAPPTDGSTSTTTTAPGATAAPTTTGGTGG
jgi:Tfp pilus assembly protein PilO